MSAPESSTRASRFACASKRSAGAEIWKPALLREQPADALGELGVGVDPGPGRGAAERDLTDPPERVADAVGAEPDLGGEAAELLAERDRDRVHQVGAPRLHVVGELVGLGGERRREAVERRQQVVGDLAERRQVDGGREDVVRRLAHVDVVVGMGPVAGEVGDHLVRVHVRRRAGAGLEGVDGELVVVLAVADLVAGGGDPLGEVGVELAELGVDPRRGGLQAAEPVDDGGGDRVPGDREVRDRLVGLAAPELLAHVRRHRFLSSLSLHSSGYCESEPRRRSRKARAFARLPQTPISHQVPERFREWS